MSKKHYAASVVVVAVIAALLTLGVAGCSSNGSSAVSSLATSTAVSTAVAKAKDQANACVSKVGGVSGLLSSANRTDFFNCMKSLVPADKWDGFKSCITSAATTDQIWTSAGLEKFTNESLPNCMNAAT